jgi:hypothetical protein
MQTIYLSSPSNQMQAAVLTNMPVLVSYACTSKWIKSYIKSFSRILIDSGAYSVFNSGKTVNLDDYAEFASAFEWADGTASLDDIAGDWELGMDNWLKYPWMFPTYHDSDPPQALDEILNHNPSFIGLGIVPDKSGQRNNIRWLLETLDRIPPSTHIHGWALRKYARLKRINSMDSTNWIRDSWKVKNKLPWMTPSECVEIVVKRYQRDGKKIGEIPGWQNT